MRLIRKLVMAALSALAVTAFVGVTSASALYPTMACKIHTGLLCQAGEEQTHIHGVLQAGTVGKLLSNLVNILCLGVLFEVSALALNNPQTGHMLEMKLQGCGTSATHNNCIIAVEELLLGNVLKTGLDEGVLTATSGRVRLKCPSIGIDCVYDFEGAEFAVGANHVTAESTPMTELGGKFFCPNEGLLDGLVESLLPTYVLQ